MQAFYDARPSVLEAVGNGSYLYRFNIEEVIPEVTDENTKKLHTSQFKCEEVTVWPPLTSNKITEAVITEKWTHNYEQKLVNEYNEVKLGLTDGADAERKVEHYRSYLAERAAIKATIDNDCLTLGIR